METTLRLADISRLNRHEFAVLIGYTLIIRQRHLDECRNVPDIDFSVIGPVELPAPARTDDGNYRTAQRSSRGSHWTAQLAEADQQRDRAMAALRAAARLHLLRSRAEEQAASRRSVAPSVAAAAEIRTENYAACATGTDLYFGQSAGERSARPAQSQGSWGAISKAA